MNDQTPNLTVDIIIEIQDWYPFHFTDSPTEPKRRDGIVLIKRKNEPHGWALPGGFVDVGETTMQAAIREAQEETGLQITGLEMLGVYDDPDRDPRQHNVSVAYIAKAIGKPRGMDDAAEACIFDPTNMPQVVDHLCFDHRKIITDYLLRKKQ